MIIIGILAVTVITAWPSGDGSIVLRNQAEQMAVNLRYYHYLAMVENSTVLAHFTANSYSFTEADGSTPINSPATDSNVFSLPSGTSLSVTQGGASLSLLAFAADGTPYTNAAATVPLVSHAIFRLSSSGKVATFYLRLSTGAVTDISMSG